MGFGDNIAQGAAIGLQRFTPLAALAGQRMAGELLPRMPVSIQGQKYGITLQVFASVCRCPISTGLCRLLKMRSEP